MKAPNLIEPIVENFLKHLGNRDLDNITCLFSDEIDWYIPGNEKEVQWLGKRNNNTEVKDFFKQLWANTQPISASIERILYADDHAVIVGQFSTKMLQTDHIAHSIFFIYIVIENQKIIKYRLLEDSYAVSEAMLK